MFRLLTFSLFILSLLPAISSLPCIGVTHHFSRSSSPHRIPTALHSLNTNSLLLRDSDPHIIRPFLYTNVSVFLTIPNSLVSPIATNRSNAVQWLYHHVVPFYPRVNITTISVGNDFTVASPQAADLIFPAIRNVYSSLHDLGIHNVAVSTSFSFVSVITKSFPPSAARFQDFAGVDIMGPLLQFLSHTNSSFLINLYPYNMYKLNSAIPIGFALFEEHPFNFRDDIASGVRYQNLFDMMIDAVVSAMGAAGYENIPIVVTETGWPSTDAIAEKEEDTNEGYAEMYLKGLVKHLKAGKGTPLRKEGVACVYVYELFDEEDEGTRESGRHWGILYPNLTNKYSLQFSGSWSARAGEAEAWVKILLEVSFVSLVLLSH
ncbi:glucan endo-1,3-beta-glucosidase 12-like [Neltuma alba]|uniref:glucan endo-1,3-beta-glucosidase 12-like n=1 Tax=Neltuma alba TaxID=207710 RepID=UPI0010A386B6|nr:glucan endo-1,3-beta-glucosidase 12-like [Prosopis alba]